MPERSADGRLVVRLMPHHAGTVLWSDGAVEYSTACLSPGLEADLRAWDDFQRTRLDPDLRAHDPADERRSTRTGAALAERLADELGAGFEVHLAVVDGEVHWSSEPPTNPRAARALHARAERDEAESRAVAALGEDGWYAYAPLSGRRFTPSGPAASGDRRAR